MFELDVLTALCREGDSVSSGGVNNNLVHVERDGVCFRHLPSSLNPASGAITSASRLLQRFTIVLTDLRRKTPMVEAVLHSETIADINTCAHTHT